MAVDSFEIATGHVTIDTKYDGRRVSRLSYREGHRAGTWFHRGFQHGSLRRFNKTWKVFFKPLNNLKKWLTRLRLPAIFAGLTGSALALVPTIAQLSSAVGAGAVPAFLGLYSTIFLVRGMLGKFASSIENQVQKKMDEVGDTIKKITMEAAKPGLNAFLKEALTHAPLLTKYVRELGQGMGQVGYAFEDLLDREENIRRIRTTLDGTSRATRIWYSLLDDAAEVILVIAAAGTPLFERFTRSMERVGKTVHNWILLQESTGALQRYLNNAYETLEKFGRGSRDFLIGLFNIINGGVFGSERVADSFERWGASFREWTTHSENIDKIRKTIAWFVDHTGQFFRFAAAATAVQLALVGISRIKGMITFVRTLIGLKASGFILFGIGAALSSLAGGFVFAYTHSQKFRDELHKLVKEVSDRLAPIFRDWWNWAKTNLIPLLEELAIRGIGELSKSIHGLLDTVDKNKEALAEWRPVILFLVKAISYLTGFAIKGLIEELGGLITILGWVGRGIGLLRRLFANLPGWIGTAVDAVAGYFNTLRERAGRTVDHTAKAFRELPGKIADYLKTLPGALVKSIRGALDTAVVIVGYGLGTIVEYFVRLPGRVIGALDLLWDFVWGSVEHGIGRTVDFFALLPGRVMRWFDRTWDSAYETTVEWFDTITDFVKALPGRAASALVTLVPRIVGRFRESWSGAQKESGNHVSRFLTWVAQIPGRVWAGLVKLKNRLVERFATGWSAATGTSKDQVARLINFILGIPGRAFNALRALAARLSDRARTGWAAFQERVRTGASATVSYIAGLPARFVRALGSIGTRLRESGRQLLQGFLVGVQARIAEIGGLGGWFKRNLVDPVVNAVKRFFGIASPSRVFRGIGGNIVAGLWQGIAKHNPVKMINKIFGGMPQALGKLLEKGMIQVQSLPGKALKALGSLWGGIGDFFGGGGRGGGTGGTVGNAAIAWQMLAQMFGLPMGGWRAHGSVPGSDHPKGKAIDVMTTNPVMHQAIIAFARAALPGLKYWISMGRIATAAGGWVPHGYSGPSPHTDHVHLSFFRQGTKRLPEDILGFGKSGRGYVMHKGEQVIRRNETTIGHQGSVNHYHFQPGSVVLDASTVRDMREVVDLIKGLQSTARQYGAGRAVRVA